jgi:hypothetical protein
MSRKKRSILQKSIPVWLALLLAIDVAALVGFVEYTVMQRRIDRLQRVLSTTQNPEELIQKITSQVLPSDGYSTSVVWGDLGERLVEVGAVDRKKYEEIFNSNTNGKQELVILDESADRKIMINENNARFVVNTLWALGLVNKSKVLNEGPMKTSGTDTANFASTAGWTLGSKPAMELYSSKELVRLTDEQQELVKRIAENVYRPCCGNHTAFPDCNHGMAALGYIELAVANGLSEDQIYRDLLAMNSFWFPTTYVEMAVYFDKEQGIDWSDVDPKLALSQQYSSAQGASEIRQAVQDVPGIKSQGGSCGA